MIEMPELLKHVTFLHGLAETDLKWIAEVAELREIHPGGVVFREGERTPFIFVVVEGRVSLEICAPGLGCMNVHTVGEGELLGWSPLLDTGPMTATARAVVPTRVLALHAPQLIALSRHTPRLETELMRRTAQALAQRLNATRLQLLDVYRHEVPVGVGEGGLR